MLPYLFVLLAIAVRFFPFLGLNLPHAWHFTPLAASLLFFGARGSRRQLWVPLVLLAAADIVLTRFMWKYPFTWDELFVWAWYAAILWLGTNLRERSGFWRVVAAAAASSISFFIVSNFAVWAAWPGMYPRSVAGLIACYTAAIPFFRGTAVSDLFFSLVMFGIPALQQTIATRMHNAGDRRAAA
ncbi:MAG TPA: DUF6580 family putative transport protein [Candidatus Binatia bacterium]|nr:DUF6580 family putative transport protein [Candidatus Binatia bacterium]